MVRPVSRRVFLGFSADPHHHLVLVRQSHFWPDDPAGALTETEDQEISPGAAMQFAMNLISAAKACYSKLVDDALAGECSDCGNLRMIEVDKPGAQKELVHCPTCWPRIEASVATLDVFEVEEAAAFRKGR